MLYWDESSYPSELLPPCAAVRHVTEEHEHRWKTVKGGRETKARSETQIMMMEVCSGGGNEIRRARGDDEQ